MAKSIQQGELGAVGEAVWVSLLLTVNCTDTCSGVEQEGLLTVLNFLGEDITMTKTSWFSGVALATAVLSLGVAAPVFATGSGQRPIESTGLLSEGSALHISSPEVVAARRCVNRRVYHAGYYTRGIFGRRVYHKPYYSTKRVCY